MLQDTPRRVAPSSAAETLHTEASHTIKTKNPRNRIMFNPSDVRD
jgi:hypothetical protein